jgi:hypothetical protein
MPTIGTVAVSQVLLLTLSSTLFIYSCDEEEFRLRFTCALFCEAEWFSDNVHLFKYDQVHEYYGKATKLGNKCERRILLSQF